jgi:hypothetical protein
MEFLQKYLNKADVPDWLRTGGNVAFDTLQGGLTTLAATKNPYAAIAGSVAGGAMSIAKPYGEEGDGSEDPTAPPSLFNPLQGSMVVTSEFGKVRYLTFDGGQKSPTYGKPHGGVDLRAAEGTNVFAVRDGIVEATGFDAPGFGNYVKTQNPDGTEHYYGHLSQKLVPGGTSVKAGQLIGLSGKSGPAGMGPHLHFEVRKGGNKLDPMSYLSGANQVTGDPAVPPSNSSSLTLKKGAGNLILQPMGGESGTPSATYGIFNKANSQAQTINYGGVTITFNMPEKSASDVKAIANEVRRVLSDDSIREKAVNR